MKRFLYDLALILILLMIAINLDDSTVYENKQEQLKMFEKEIKEEKVIEKNMVVTVHQIKDNNASKVANTVSDICKEIVRGGIFILKDFFEIITKT